MDSVCEEPFRFFQMLVTEAFILAFSRFEPENVMDGNALVTFVSNRMQFAANWD